MAATPMAAEKLGINGYNVLLDEERCQATLDEKFQKMVDSKKAKATSVALQINDLQLNRGDKLYLIHVFEKIDETGDHGKNFRNKSLRLDIWYGIFAAVVPITIPFSQTFKEAKVPMTELNAGTCISVLAVICSLMGTILTTYARASKAREQSVLYDNESNSAQRELTSFVAKAGPYFGLDDKVAYAKFCVAYNNIRQVNERCRLFGAAPKQEQGKQQQAGGGEDP